MKQRVRVVGIVKSGDAFLFLKKKSESAAGPSIWTLPASKIIFGEQPEEAMARIMYEDLGLQAESLRLKDVVTFIAANDEKQVANLYIIYEIGVSKQAKLELSEKYRAYRYIKGVETGEMRLDETTMAVMQLESGKNEEVINYRGAAHGATIYVDGASRGNPGASGIGYRVVAEDGRELMRGNEFVGFATSRVAEYYALKKGCEVAIELGLKSVRFVSDSLMVVNQMNGVYKVKNHDLFRIYRDIRRLLKNFEACAFIHVKREQNKEADAEANQAINEHGVFGTKV